MKTFTNYSQTRKSRGSLFVAGLLALSLAFSSVACSKTDESNEVSRPSVAEIQVGMTQIMKSNGTSDEDLETDLAKEFVKCLSTGIHKEEKLPNEVVRALSKGEDPTIDKKNEVAERLMNEITDDCSAQVLS